MIQLPIGKQNKPFNTKEKRIFSSISDPRHGWLSVSIKDIKDLGIADKITRFSLMNSTRVFLEEDVDMGVFLKAAKNAGWEIEIKENYSNKASCRSYANYNQQWIKQPFEIGRTVYGHENEEYIVEEKNKKGWTIKATDGSKYHLPRLNPLKNIFPYRRTNEQSA